MPNKTLTIIIPCYNAAAFIENSFYKIEQFIAENTLFYAMFIDDGSSDDTYHKLIQCRKNSIFPDRIIILKNPTNLGKGGTIKRSILESTTDLLVFTDADMAYYLDNITTFYANIHSKEICIANRVHPKSYYHMPPYFFKYVFSRHLSSRIFNWCVRQILLKDIQDTQAGLKMFWRTDFIDFPHHSKENDFCFDIELLCYAQDNGIVVRQMPVDFRYDHETSTVSFITHAFKMAFKLLKIAYRKHIIHYYKRK